MRDNLNAEFDWSGEDLLVFPRMQSYMERERRKQREFYRNLQREAYQRRLKEEEMIIKRIDVDMNMDRLMFQDTRFQGLRRRKQIMSKVFGKIMMTRIVTDAAMLNKYKDNPGFEERYNARLEERVVNFFPRENRLCDRYYKNHYKIDRSGFKKNKLAAENGEEEEVQIVDVAGEEEKLPDKLPDINKPRNVEDSADEPKQELIEIEAIEGKENAQTEVKEEKPIKASTLRPKNQVASVSHLKLPKIR
jgi:hypothetical protein